MGLERRDEHRIVFIEMRFQRQADRRADDDAVGARGERRADVLGAAHAKAEKKGRSAEALELRHFPRRGQRDGPGAPCANASRQRKAG